jgi:hypothetical protein
LHPRLTGSPGAQKPEHVEAARDEQPPVTRSEVVYITLPPEHVAERIEQPVAPQVVQPIINVTIEPERKRNEGQPLSPIRNPWPEKERATEPLPAVPAAVAPLPVPEKEYQYIPLEERKARESEVKSIPEPEQKTIPGKDKNNSETEQKQLPEGIVSELFGPDKPAPQAASEEAYDKKGKVGRQRRYEEAKEDIPPVKEVVLYYCEMGRHWPGMSEDMQAYYEYWYFTKPSRGKDGKDYERHLKAHERYCKWYAEEYGEAAPSVGSGGKVVPMRKRAAR